MLFRSYPFPSLATIASNGWRLTVTTISGLSHLEGQSVAILGDGAVVASQVVMGGSVSLPIACSKVQIGIACPAKLQTMRLNAGGTDGTSQGKTARINKVSIRFHESLGMLVGQTFDAMDEINFRAVNDLMDAPPALFTGDKIIDFSGDYNTNQIGRAHV